MTDPRPEVVALAEALCTMKLSGPCDDHMGEAEDALAHLPAPWRLVDVDEWRALADEARLVSQWADSLDPMPEVLRGELRDLGTSARRLLEGR